MPFLVPTLSSSLPASSSPTLPQLKFTWKKKMVLQVKIKEEPLTTERKTIDSSSQVKIKEEALPTGRKTIDSSSAPVGYSFFRLLFPDSNFVKQLRLPRSFSDRAQVNKPNEHQQIAELVNPKGKSWKVNLCKDAHGFYCFNGEGWQGLASAHHLKLGYFLTFDYNGSMLFSFRVYGLNTMEIENYPSQEEEEEEEEEEETEEVVDEEKAIFEAIICSTNLDRSYMSIPKACKKLFELSKEGNKTKVVLMDGEGRKWPVRLMYTQEDRKTRSYISCGWLSFACGNELRRGDRCVLNLFTRSMRA